MTLSVRRFLALASVLLLLSAGIVHSASADGLTVYPSSLNFPDTFRGGQYITEIGIVNDSDSAAVFHFQKEGPVTDWVTFVEVANRANVVESVQIGANQRGGVIARLDVPADAANGKYEGAIFVVRRPVDELDKQRGTTGGASVNLGAKLGVVVDVSGTQRIEGSFLELAAADTEVGYLLEAISTIQNSGNVLVVPEITVSILSGGTLASTKTFADESLYPAETKRILTQVETTKLTPGDYTARVQVKMGDKDLGTVEKPFKLMPVGTFTRQGVLDDLSLLTTPVKGSTAKAVARFRNTGRIASKAVFVGEVYRNGTLIKAIQGVERSVAQGQQAVLEVFIDIPDNGNYRLVGKVSFEGNETEPRELSFTVGSGTPTLLYGGIAGGALAVLAAGAGAFMLMRRRRASTGLARALDAGDR